MPKDHCEDMLTMQDKQEPIVLERSARLNLDPERGDKGEEVDRGDRDDRGDGTGGEEGKLLQADGWRNRRLDGGNTSNKH